MDIKDSMSYEIFDPPIMLVAIEDRYIYNVQHIHRGKWYSCKEFENWDNGVEFYFVLDEFGTHNWYPTRYFKTRDEMRDHTLDELLNG
jgi:hypothetical protein